MTVDATPTNLAHLLRRAAWGATSEEIEQAVSDGVEATVDRLLDPSAAPAAGDAFRRAGGPEAYSPPAFVAWWYGLATRSSTPGIERLAWFWHGHFATGLRKVRWPSLLRDQLVTLRRHGLGRFDDLLELMANDAAMNVWLDLHTSFVGAPNENFARELMELFSLGVDKGYEQTDVAEAARAFTGYGLLRSDALDRPIGTRLRPELHDYGTKTVLGRTGTLTGSDVIAEIVERPECHRFVAQRFWLRYAGTEPSPEVIDELAAVFARDLLVSELLRAMLVHEEFYSADVRSGLVTHPVEILVRTVRNFGLPVVDVSEAPPEETIERDRHHGVPLLRWSEMMGQLPGFPPNVAGWPHNEGWLTSNRAAGRLLAGVEIGRVVASLEAPIADGLRAIASRPEELMETIFGRFGVVEWSSASARAAMAAAGGASGPDAVAAAFAAVFASPEVTLA